MRNNPVIIAAMKRVPDSPLSLLRSFRRPTPGSGSKRREYTIDELARESGSTVRNIRAYQDRGLLPAPEKRGRTGIYTDVHLARLRIISRLLDRGFTIANIKDLLAAWEEGRDLNDVLGLEVVVTKPWNEEAPAYVDYEDLIEWFGEQLTPEVLSKAASLGYIYPESNRLRVPSPRILNAGRELAAGGIPLDALLDQVNEVRSRVEEIADGFVRLVVTHLIDMKYGDQSLPPSEETGRLADFIKRVRPIADMVVSAELARILDQKINSTVVDRLARVLEQTNAGATKDQSGRNVTNPAASILSERADRRDE